MAGAILNLSGLPTNRSAILYDLLARTNRNGKWESIPVRVVTIADDGTLTVTGLRDSRYALLFTIPKLTTYSRYKLDFGDKSKYRRIYLSDPLPAPALESAIPVIQLNEIVVTIHWRITSDQAVQSFDVYTRQENISKFALSLSVPDRTSRFCELRNLQAESSYECYLIARGIGMQSKRSNVVTFTSPPLPVSEPNLIINGNFEVSSW